MRHTLKSTSLFSVSLGLLAAASCTTVGPNFKQPAAPAVSTYAMTGEPAAPNVSFTPDQRAAGAWWQALGDSKLDALIRQALKDSPDIAMAEANVRSARADAAARQGDRAPRIDAQAGAQRERINIAAFGFSGFPSPTINLYQFGGTVSYDFDIFGRKRRAAEAAEARASAERQRADAVYLTLTASVAEQAVRIAALRAEIESVTQTTKGDQEVIDLVKQAQAAGGAPRSATSIGEAQLAADLALLPPLERQLAEARHRLALLLGKTPGEWAAPDFALSDFTAPNDVPVAIPSALVRRRPDILAAEHEAHAATADVGVATANLYPNLSLSGNLTQAALKPEDLFQYADSGWSVAAGLASPVFHGGTLRKEKERAVAEADAAMANYRKTVINAFVEVSDALSGLSADQRALEAQARAVTTARANVEDATRAFQLGAGTLLNVFDAQRQLNLALRANIQAQGQKLDDIIDLFVFTASDWR